MPQFSSGLITAGIGTVLEAFSCKTDDTVKRDGRSSLVSSVASTATGAYEFTLSQKLPQMIAGVASVQNADGTPADRTCQVGYNATTGVVTVYTLAAAVLTDPEANAVAEHLWPDTCAIICDRIGRRQCYRFFHCR